MGPADRDSADAGGATLFTDRLRSTSRRAHSVSDALVNFKLVAACSDQRLYEQALSYFYLIYDALEQALERHQQTEGIAPFARLLPRVRRAAAMQSDLEYFRASSAYVCNPKPAVKQYLQHIQHLSDKEPLMLVVHCYTQHMAILAGGQIIKKMVQRAMQLPPDAGTATFQIQEGPVSLRNKYKDTMNALGNSLDEATIEQLLKEHLRVFTFNNAIVRGLDATVVQTVLSMLKLIPSNMLIPVIGVGLVIGAVCWSRVYRMQ